MNDKLSLKDFGGSIVYKLHLIMKIKFVVMFFDLSCCF